MNDFRQSGMTLLEVLVATSILAVVSVMAFVSIDNMARSKTTLKKQTLQLNEVNLAFYQLQNDLQMAVSGHMLNAQVPAFMGQGEGFTLYRYKNQQATSSRINTNGSLRQQPLQRVRWFARGQQLIRAVQGAHGLMNGNGWVEQPMMVVDVFTCDYVNVAGQVVRQWPENQFDNAKLPTMVQCILISDTGAESTFKVVPWQAI